MYPTQVKELGILTSIVVKLYMYTYWFAECNMKYKQCFHAPRWLLKLCKTPSISLFLSLLVPGAKNSFIKASKTTNDSASLA
jgi:hypothetical protein